ncbi:MAG: hypothetical protein FRX49_09562 [Trebouxia sp. A1-2]|nr:MAG: hypothetical protein FRX49_09562 [Trebouxia sp. A1-2]
MSPSSALFWRKRRKEDNPLNGNGSSRIRRNEDAPHPGLEGCQKGSVPAVGQWGWVQGAGAFRQRSQLCSDPYKVLQVLIHRLIGLHDNRAWLTRIKAACAALTLTASALSSCSFISPKSKAAILDSCSSIAHTINDQ